MRTESIVKKKIEKDQRVTFLLGQEEYAFDIMYVKEIMAGPNIPVYIEGVVH